MEKSTKPASFSHRRQWRLWLRRNHAKRASVWLRLDKKHTGVDRLAYADAVEEALCFGWIDGMIRRIDARRYMVRFSPRKPGSVWAPSNIARVKKLIRQKKMTAAGLALFRAADLNKVTAPTATTQGTLVLPRDLKQALVNNGVGWRHFRGYPRSNRRIAIWWVKSAKKAETRQRRIRNIVSNASKYPRPHY